MTRSSFALLVLSKLLFAFAWSSPNCHGLSGTFQDQPSLEIANELLVLLKSDDVSAGEETWHNFGTLGNFTRIGAPAKTKREGVSALVFSGTDAYQGPVAPSSIVGSQARTIEVWAWNPEVDDEETLVAWGRRDEPAGNFGFNFGRNPKWGAASLWGTDMGWKEPPPANRWCHLVITYDGENCNVYNNGGLLATLPTLLETHPEGTINVAAQNASEGGLSNFSALEIARIRIHAGVLSQEQINHNFDLEAEEFKARSWLLERERDLQDPGLQSQVNQAIRKGVEYLLEVQELDGSWRHHLPSYASGSTALALYALMKSGLSKSHPAIRRGIAFLRSHPPRKTYSLSMGILALIAHGTSDHQDLIEAWTKKIIKTQQTAGFAYPEGNTDLSNTQYAALALHAAAKAGQTIPRGVWSKLALAVLKYQGNPGPQTVVDGFRYAGRLTGFGYRPGDSPTMSMTAAGLATLTLCDQNLRLDSKSRKAATDAHRWLAHYFSVSTNPSERNKDAKNHLYYAIYGIERVGAFLETETFGKHNWYREGASFLVNQQSPEGFWQTQSDTCFALLFLSRGSRAPVTGSEHTLKRNDVFGADDPKVDVSLRAAGTSKITLWISSFGEEAKKRFGRGPQNLIPVIQVAYYLTSEEPRVLVTSLDGNPDDPKVSDRFETQIEFTRPGPQDVVAEVKVQGLDGESQTITSPPLTITPSEFTDPLLLDYAQDGSRNLMLEAGAEVTASTESVEGTSQFLVDNYLATAWKAAEEDSSPRLAIRLKKTMLADTLLFSHPYVPGSSPKERPGSARKLRVRINKKIEVEVDLDPNVLKKSKLTLEKPVKVALLEIQILEWDTNRPPGFCEIELQNRNSSSK